MKLTFLGTGTSHGVPVIGCECAVCKSSDSRDKRYRSSVYIETQDKKHILIDIGPEFRIQALENNLKKVDAVLLTHSHADHLHGIDDLRNFSCEFKHTPENPTADKYHSPAIPIYANEKTKRDIEHRFDYFFKTVKEGGGHAKVQLLQADNQFTIGNTIITPIPMMHGHLPTTGWLLTETAPDGAKKSIAYLTDCNFISNESIALIKKNCGNLKHLIIDGLRIKPHSTHFSFLEALEASEKIGGEQIWFTHLTHHHSHKDTLDYIETHKGDFPGLKQSKSILPAYDKLIIET